MAGDGSRSSRFFRRVGELLAGRFMLSLIALAIVLGLAWSFRWPLLRGVGHFLIKPDKEVPADAVYVLGGSPLERGVEAARLLKGMLSQ